MNWTDGPLVLGQFVERLHRFGATVIVGGRREYCHVPNSGRLRELLYPGAKVALVDHQPKLKIKMTRKTRFALRLAFYQRRWVCIEANIAPKLLHEGWKKGLVPGLKPYDQLQAEVSFSVHTRFDFQARNSQTGEKAWVEVKCATLVDEKGIGRFPDAPSERASKHLRELTAQVHRPKTKSFVFFILQNPLGKAMGPQDQRDPIFGKTLRRAFRRGVILEAFRARVNIKGASLERRIRVLL